MQTTAGTFYALGVAWACSATYYSATYGSDAGADGGVGDLVGNAYGSGFTGYSTTYIPSGTDGATGANYDQVVSVIR